jgi:hypothetical protein
MDAHAGGRMNGRIMVGAALVLVLAGCGREERTLVTTGVLTEERGASTAVMGLEGRLFEGDFREAEFRQMWNAVTSAAAPFDAMALTLSGGTAGESGVSRLAGMVLVTPLPLARGARYEVGRALPPPARTGMPMYWSSWGRRDLQTPGQAEIAYRSFDYHAVGMIVENDFVAESAAGTVEVVERHRGDQVVLRADITMTAADGRTVRLRGDIRVVAERYTPPFS